MHKNAMKCNKTQSKWCINKHGASKIIDTFETYQYPVGVLDDTCMLTMTRTCLGPKSSSMRFGYLYSWDMRFSTYGLTNICFIFVLTITLTIQDAYNGGNERSKLVSTIIFGRFIKICNHYSPLRRAFLLLLC
jgi:hypothetical protein